MKTNIVFLFILSIMSLSYIGCSDLSRGKAKDLILDKKDAKWNSLTLTASLNNGLGGYDIRCSEMSSKDNFQQQLIEAGFIKFKTNYFGINYYDLTTNILPFKISEQFDGGFFTFKLADIDDVNITGITGNDVYKNVEFTISYKPNEIGKLVLDPSSLTKQLTLAFKKYDDGWRID